MKEKEDTNESLQAMLVRGLQQQIGEVKGLQRFLRDTVKVDSHAFDKKNADKVNLRNLLLIVFGIPLKFNKRDFTKWWTELGLKIYDLSNEHYEKFIG